jgi:hypothetical protein
MHVLDPKLVVEFPDQYSSGAEEVSGKSWQLYCY